MSVVGISAKVRPGNERSIRLLVRIGMRPAGSTLVHGLSGAPIEHILYELPAGAPCRSAQPEL